MTATPSPALVDARAHAAAVKTALNAELNDAALEADEVPGTNGNTGTPPNIFVVMSVERRGGYGEAPLRTSATTGRTGWRIALRCVGRTVSECQWAQYKAAVALNQQRLTISGVDTSLIRCESEEAPTFRDGRYSGDVFYTYAH